MSALLLKAWELLKPMLGPLLGFTVLWAAGFASAEFYEHTVPWGLKHKLTASQKAFAAEQLAYGQLDSNRKLWVTEQKKDLALIDYLRKQAQGAVNEREDAEKAAGGDGFEKGYAAGLAVGRRSGTNHASPTPGAPADAGGVHDPSLLELWSGAAYRPPGSTSP